MTIVSRYIIQSYISRGKGKYILYGALFGLLNGLLFCILRIAIDRLFVSRIDIWSLIILSVVCFTTVGMFMFSMLYRKRKNDLMYTETDSSGNIMNPTKKSSMYVGNVISIKPARDKKDFVIRLDNGDKKLSVLVGKELAVGMSVGETWTVGYIEGILINIRPGIHPENEPI